MPRVTRLESTGSRDTRVRVHLDGEPRCVLPRSVVDELGVAEGRDLDGEEVDRLLARGRRQEALDAAFAYLGHRARSERELERHLRGKGFEDVVVEQAVARCRELDYVDDREFALSYVRDRIRLKPRGVFRLKAELRKKGVSDADAEAGIARAFEQEEVTERDLLERAARKRWSSRRTEDPEKLRRRLYGYLQRRGFPATDIYDVVDRLMDRLEDGRSR